MVPPPRLVVASQNVDKIAEVEAVLGELAVPSVIVRGLAWPAVAETADTLEGNALIKARAVRGYTGLPALADDTGLEVEALGGAPGVCTSRFAGDGATYADNVALLLALLGEAPERSARFLTTVALVDADGEELVAHGELRGTIARSPRGEGGFGYDPVFEVGARTLAEMGVEEKNRISHRARALRALFGALSW